VRRRDRQEQIARPGFRLGNEVNKHRRLIMKWTRMYLLGYIILIIGVLAALWKLKILASIGIVWTLIGVVILTGIGIMISVSNSGKKENIEIDRK
jgi:hypothetical protein